MVELLQLLDDVLKKKINISDFLDALVVDALKSGASDIHIESKEDDILLVRYRVDGVLRDIISIGPELKDTLLFIIKVRAKLRTDVHLAPQDGKIPFVVKKADIDGDKEKIKKEEENDKDQEKDDAEKPIEEKEEEEQEKKVLNRLEALKAEVSKLIGKDVNLNIVEVKNIDTDAQLVAENIAGQLERRISFRRAMKQCMQKSLKAGALGIKTSVSGRLGGADMARTEFYKEGNIPLQTLRADIDYGFAEADTTYGKIGVKVWIYKGEVLPTKKMEGGDQ